VLLGSVGVSVSVLTEAPFERADAAFGGDQRGRDRHPGMDDPEGSYPPGLRSSPGCTASHRNR